MSCPQCVGIETEFGHRTARRELRRYRRKGVGGPTRLLAEAILEAGGGETVLHIGGGVGALLHRLLEGGARAGVMVEASSAYLEAAREEAERRGLQERIEFHHGDFLEITDALPPVDVVTLDKVICCYPEMESLVASSAEGCRRLWGAIYPRDHVLSRLGTCVTNLVQRVRRVPFRVFVHPPSEIRRVLRGRGFRPRSRRRTLLWEVEVWERAGAPQRRPQR